MLTYSENYPEAEPLTSLIFFYGEETTLEILKQSRGREIKILMDRNRPDWLDFDYIEN
jgi:hypothetical protein